MKSSTCPHPAGQQRVLFPARDYITGDRFFVQRCDACGIARTLPRPSPEGMARYYPAGYYGGGQRYPRPLEWALERLYAARARTIEDVTGLHGGRVLDIGCGRGSLLAALRARGWSAVGTEISEMSARYARDVLHLEVYTGDLSDAAFDGPFDLVVLWHVLEHVPDPAALLEEIEGLLRPGGSLLVAVPNFGSLEARLGRGVWFHLDVPRHLNHFTRSALRRLVQGAGLVPYRAGYFSIEYDVFSFTQTMLNLLGFRHNGLYNLIRHRGAKMLQDGMERPARGPLLTLALAPLLGAASVLWTSVAGALHGGATVTLIAHKPAR